MKRWGCLAAIVVGLWLLACAGMAVPAEAAFFLVAGWVFFLSNVGSQVTVSWPGITTAIVALAVFIVGFQSLGGWWMSATQANNPPEQRRHWQWRWTLIATAAVVLSFTAGIAVVGATHQFAWMATSKEPFIDNTWEPARRTQSRNNLKQIGLALHNYENKEQRFPAGGTFDQLGRPLFSWQTALLPYIDEANLFDRMHLDVPWDAAENTDALATHVKPYQIWQMAPEEVTDASGKSLTHYSGNGRVLNAGPGLALPAFKDGTSNTFMAGEAKANFKPWGYPVNWRDAKLGINRSPDGFGSPWKGGAHLLLADGSVRFVSENLDAKVFEALSTPDGGELVREF